MALRGLSCLAARGSTWELSSPQGLNPSPLHWKADSLPWDHGRSPLSETTMKVEGTMEARC